MKRRLLQYVLPVCLAGSCASLNGNPPPEPPPPGTPLSLPNSPPKRPAETRPLENYQQILAVLPASPSVKDAQGWTQDEKDAANRVFTDTLVTPQATARFKVHVGQIARWPGPTLFVEVPNKEGYHIRIFGGFTEEWDARLKQLKKGDEVIMEGTFSHVTFKDVWNAPSLSIGLTNSSFVLSPAAKTRHTDVLIISAVYGSGARFADVTARVNGLVHQPEVAFLANPQWLETDPHPGRKKTLVVVYDFKGKRHVFSTGEDVRVNAESLARHADEASAPSTSTPASPTSPASPTDEP
ncbi:hypothetical protein [Verrucomicrobium sp. BvORR106]|uniref:hypothetical protein n=1 Tax=Verrucomicrobium sp. BvORR106 TaxID=1403819 RepID=UPI00056F2402|nr:hypothetical protein [Verrucomicrobium sp. BvORR106]